MLKAFKYRLNPTQEQIIMLSKHFGCARFVYNWGLNEKSKAFKETGENISCFKLSAMITDMKSKQEYQWLKEVDSQSLQMSLRCLDNAYTNFFKKKSAFPNFKKRNRHQSFQYPQRVKIVGDNKIYLPKIGHVHFYKSREMYGEIKAVTVSKTPTGKYFVSILCDIKELKTPKKAVIKKETSVGVDLGIKSFAVLSNGKIFENQKYLSNNLRRLRIEQRKLQRCVKGSKNREKQRIVVALLHEKISNQRLDFTHKFTTYLVKNFDSIIMEDLNVKGMIKNKNLSRSIGEMAWSMANNQLQYKCEWNGKNYIKINRFEPSSKRCNNCGEINRDLKLQHRTWTCGNCGSVLDRDLNASLNIRDIGLGAKPINAKAIH